MAESHPPVELLTVFAPILDAVIMRFSFESRRLPLVTFVHRTRPERIRVGLTSAIFKRDNIAVAILSELQPAVFHCIDGAALKARADECVPYFGGSM